MQTHWDNASANNPGYSYRKIVVSSAGVITTTVRENTSILYAVKDDNWDYITFQQVSQDSGLPATYFPYLTNLLQYVKNNATNQNVKYALHQTWAYAANSTHSGFLNYNSNQMTMYNAIVNTYNQVSNQTGIDIIIPSGTAIQNGRSSYVGDNFNRDGYHLSYGLGRYTAACTWYEKLLGRLVVGNTFVPTGVSASEAWVAQNAGHYAVINPSSVTSMVGYTAPPVITPTPLTNKM